MIKVCNKKNKKRIAAVMVLAMTALSFAGCGGSSEPGKGDNGGGSGDATAVKSYKNETIDLGVENSEFTNIFNISYSDGNVYYIRYDYPQYPQEYYDDLEKISGTADNYTEETVQDENGKVEQRTVEGKSDDSAGDSDISDAKKEDKAASDDSNTSDDELLGNVDDLFGDGKKDDKKDDKKTSDDKKTDDGKSADDKKESGDITTYEDLEKKYADYKSKSAMYKYNIDSGETTELFDITDSASEDFGSFRDFCIRKNGNILAVSENNSYDEKTDTSSFEYFLNEYDMKGKKVNSINLSDKMNLPKTSSEGMGVFDRLKILNEDTIFGSDDKSITIFDSKGEQKGKVESKDYINNYAFDSEGNIVMYCSKEEEYYYVKVDGTTYKQGDRIEGITDSKEYTSYTLINGNGSHALYLKNSSAFYSFDYGSDAPVELFKFMDIGIIGDYVNDMLPLDDGRIFYSYNEPDTGNMAAGIISESDEVVNDSKKVIKMMMMYSDSTVQQKIIDYNKEDNPYKVELTTFDDDDNPETSMNNQITSGNIPDIIDITSLDLNNLASKGILEDLMPYVSKDDTFNEDYFVDGYLDATKTGDKLYYLTNNFSINSLAGKASDLKKYESGWTFKDMVEYYKSKPEGTHLLMGDSKQQALYSLVLNDIDSYIDWESGKVNLDSEEFKEAVEFCNSFPNDGDVEVEDIKKNDIKDGKVLLRNEYITGTEMIQVDDKLFDGDYSYVGFPCKDKKGTYLNPSRALAICQTSDNKDGAWEIIKMLMSKPKSKNGSGYMAYYDIPSSKTEFEALIKRETTTKKYTDEDGNEVEPRDTSYGFDGFEVQVKEATEDEVNVFRNLIKSSKAAGLTSSAVSDMIAEDVTSYFEGKKQLDEVVKILQDKVSKYVNENK